MIKANIPAVRIRQRSFRTAFLVLAGALAGISMLWWALDLPLGVDVSVYRAAALAAAHGDALYGQLTLPAWAPDGLAFVYPPFAALVFLPLGFLPVQLAWGCVAVGSSVALGVVLRLFTGRAISRGYVVFGLVCAALCLQPVWRTLGMGQINIVLMGLVAVDVLGRRGSRTCGVLIGLASAVKLTPLFFILHLIIAGRRGDAVRATATFVGATTVGTVVLPGDSTRYWSQLFDGFLAAKQSWWGNQSLGGIAARVADGTAMHMLHFVLAAACVAVCVPLARMALRRTDQAAALLISAICGLLISPISWTDHWVWAAPALAYVTSRLELPRRFRFGIFLGIGSLYGGVFLFAAPAEGRPFSGTVFGAVYVLSGLVAVPLLAAIASRRTRTMVPAGPGLGFHHVS